jgi:hypothetical protein
MDVEKILKNQREYKKRRRLRDPAFVLKEGKWRKKWSKSNWAMLMSYKDFAVAHSDQYVEWVEGQTNNVEETNS